MHIYHQYLSIRSYFSLTAWVLSLLLSSFSMYGCNCFHILQSARSSHITYTPDQALFYFNVPSMNNCPIQKLTISIKASPPYGVYDKNTQGELITDWSFLASHHQQFEAYFKKNASVVFDGHRCSYLVLAFGMFIRGETS